VEKQQEAVVLQSVVPAALASAVKAQADAERRSVSALVRNALVDQLRSNERLEGDR
jgi:hypothetical protein